MLVIDNFKTDPTLRNDEIVVQILSKIGIPLTTRLLTEILNSLGHELSETHVSRICKSLKKYGEIKVATVQKATYYEVIKNEKGK